MLAFLSDGPNPSLPENGIADRHNFSGNVGSRPISFRYAVADREHSNSAAPRNPLWKLMSIMAGRVPPLRIGV